mgnify:FL=1
MPADEAQHEVSVILCSRNRAEHLRKTLQSLREVSVPEDWNAEFCLVDNASADATAEVMRAFDHPEMEVRIVREEKNGLSHARNRGVEEATGKVLLFTDDDVRVPRDWIEGMATPILEGEADAVAGGVKLAEEVRAEWMSPVHRSLLASTEEIDPEKPGRMVGANMAIAAGLFEEIPKFDPELGAGKLGAGEETLFSWKMKEAGFHLMAAFDVTVEHCPDQDRLKPEHFRELARRRGCSGGYINYHWRHHTEWSSVALFAGVVVFRARLLWSRLRHFSVSRDDGYVSAEEIELVKRLFRVRQHLIERKREPKYAPYGLSAEDEDVR